MIMAPMEAAPTNSMARNRKPLPRKYRGEEAVLVGPKAVAQHADEPQEGDAGEGHDAQRQADPPRLGIQPGREVGRLAGKGQPEQQQGCAEQHGEQNARDGGGTGRRYARFRDCSPLVQVLSPALMF
jgi:hypothetical protein